MQTPTKKDPHIEFDAAQLRWLEKQFPSVVLGASRSEAEMRHYFGAQAVIEAVRNRTRGRNNDIQSTQRIPEPR